jgi:hypothetical protein
MLLHVTLALKTLLSISQNRMDQITLNKKLGNHLNKDIINASNHLIIPNESKNNLHCLTLLCHIFKKFPSLLHPT